MAKMEGILRAVLGGAKLGESWTCGCQLEDQGKQEKCLRWLFATPKEDTHEKSTMRRYPLLLDCNELKRSVKRTSAFIRKQRVLGGERPQKWIGSRKSLKCPKDLCREETIQMHGMWESLHLPF